MKIIFCKRKINENEFENAMQINKMTKTKTKFREPSPLPRNEFQSISNIVSIEYSEDPILGRIYDKLMSKEVFAVNYENLNHFEIFEEYKKFNQKIADQINSTCDPSDLVVVNDSFLLLLPKLVRCRSSIRNLKFDHCFIERIPFYGAIMDNLFIAQKFFKKKEDLESFKNYVLCSYEFRNNGIGGCWYIIPYVDKFVVLNVLEHFKYYFECGCKLGSSPDKRFDRNILKKISELDIPLKRQVVLTNSLPLNLKDFVQNNPEVEVRFLRNVLCMDDDDNRAILYLSRLYDNFKTIDVDDYVDMVIQMVYSDIFVGYTHSEVAKCLRKASIADSFDSVKLAEEIGSALRSKNVSFNHVFGEEDYVREFMRVNGYEIVLTSDPKEDELIEELGDKVSLLIRQGEKDIKTHHEKYSSSPRKNDATVQDKLREVYYYKKNEKDSERIFYKKISDTKQDLVCHSPVKTQSQVSEPPIYGENTYDELKWQGKPKTLEKANLEEIREFWKNSSKKLLVDYDGTLVDIVEDRTKAAPTPELLEILEKLSNEKEVKLAICTGRSKKDVDEWIPMDLEVFAEHGAYHRKGGKWDTLKNCEFLDQAQEIMEYYFSRTPGSVVEYKESAIVFHYRKVKNFDVSKLYHLLKKVAGDHVSLGKCIVEVKSSKKDTVCEIVNPDIVVGDDVTDEDMFKKAKGIRIKIGEGISNADCYVENVSDFLKLLASLND